MSSIRAAVMIVVATSASTGLAEDLPSKADVVPPEVAWLAKHLCKDKAPLETSPVSMRTQRPFWQTDSPFWKDVASAAGNNNEEASFKVTCRAPKQPYINSFLSEPENSRLSILASGHFTSTSARQWLVEIRPFDRHGQHTIERFRDGGYADLALLTETASGYDLPFRRRARDALSLVGLVDLPEGLQGAIVCMEYLNAGSYLTPPGGTSGVASADCMSMDFNSLQPAAESPVLFSFRNGLSCGPLPSYYEGIRLKSSVRRDINNDGLLGLEIVLMHEFGSVRDKEADGHFECEWAPKGHATEKLFFGFSAEGKVVASVAKPVWSPAQEQYAARAAIETKRIEKEAERVDAVLQKQEERRLEAEDRERMAAKRDGCSFEGYNGVECELRLCARIAAKVRAMPPRARSCVGDELDEESSQWGSAMGAINRYMGYLLQTGAAAEYRMLTTRVQKCKTPAWFRSCSN